MILRDDQLLLALRRRPPEVPMTIRVERVYKGQAEGAVVSLRHQLWLHQARLRAGDRMLLFLHVSNGALVAGGVAGVLQTRAGQILALAVLVVAAACWLWRRRTR